MIKHKYIHGIKTEIKNGQVKWTARVNMVAGGKLLHKDEGLVPLEGTGKHEKLRSEAKAKEKGMESIIKWEKENTEAFIQF